MFEKNVSRGEAFQVPGMSLAIAETESGYTLYCSVSCKGSGKAALDWANLPAGQDAPEGWIACSEPIPANKQHYVYDIIPGCWFFLKDMTDDKVVIRY